MPAACTRIWTSSSTGSPRSISSTLKPEFSSQSRAPLVFMKHGPSQTSRVTVIIATAQEHVPERVPLKLSTCADSALDGLVWDSRHQAAVDDQLAARRIRGFVAGQEQHEVGDLDRIGRAPERDGPKI